MTRQPVVRAVSLEARIASRITPDGSAIIPPRVAYWLETKSGMTPERRSALRDTDPEAYVAFAALHAAAARRSECGTNYAVPQHHSADLNMWISTNEAAKLLSVTDRCVRNWCRTGQLHAVMSGGRWLVDRTTLALKDIA